MQASASTSASQGNRYSSDIARTSACRCRIVATPFHAFDADSVADCRSLSLRLARLVVAALLVAASGLAAAADLTVSAAASLTNAFQEIGTAFEAANPGTKVQFNFAASGPLLQQIAKGAPVDVFASADQETMNQAEQQKLVAAGDARELRPQLAGGDRARRSRRRRRRSPTSPARRCGRSRSACRPACRSAATPRRCSRRPASGRRSRRR